MNQKPVLPPLPIHHKTDNPCNSNSKTVAFTCKTHFKIPKTINYPSPKLQHHLTVNPISISLCRHHLARSLCRIQTVRPSIHRASSQPITDTISA
jgi:hypothetical protein